MGGGIENREEEHQGKKTHRKECTDAEKGAALEFFGTRFLNTRSDIVAQKKRNASTREKANKAHT